MGEGFNSQKAVWKSAFITLTLCEECQMNQKNYPFLTDHNKSYNGPILKIVIYAFAKSPVLNSRILTVSLLPNFRATREFLQISV